MVKLINKVCKSRHWWLNLLKFLPEMLKLNLVFGIFFVVFNTSFSLPNSGGMDDCCKRMEFIDDKVSDIAPKFDGVYTMINNTATSVVYLNDLGIALTNTVNMKVSSSPNEFKIWSRPDQRIFLLKTWAIEIGSQQLIGPNYNSTDVQNYVCPWWRNELDVYKSSWYTFKCWWLHFCMHLKHYIDFIYFFHWIS